MDLIPSFQEDHNRIKPEIYESRLDTLGAESATTFDIRMKRPNAEPAIHPNAMHTIEHIIATFLRNDEEWKDRIIYWGPMGCLTGCYLIVKGHPTPEEILPLMIRAFEYCSVYEGEVPVNGGEYVEKAYIEHAIMDADVFISLTHFKGHEMTGFGGTIKNIGLGCGSRAGKTDQHSNGKPHINEDSCRGCKRCMKECANSGLVFNEATKKMQIDQNNCVGCGRCIGSCNFDAIEFNESNAVALLNRKMAEYTKAVVDGRPQFHVSLVMDISPNCDCHGENDAPILPDIGMFASFDPLALDQACVDACLAAEPLPNSQLSDNLAKSGFHDYHDHFTNSTPESEWQTCLEMYWSMWENALFVKQRGDT